MLYREARCLLPKAADRFCDCRLYLLALLRVSPLPASLFHAWTQKKADASQPYSTRRNLLRRRFLSCRGIRKTVRTIKAVNEQEIHIGDSTHHHDQSIFPMSLSVMNTMVSKPTNPIPPLEFDRLSLINLLSNLAREAPSLMTRECHQCHLGGECKSARWS